MAYSKQKKGKKKRFMNKKAQVTIYIYWFMGALLCLLLASVFAPMGVKMNTEFYAIGEEMMLDANYSVSQINNTEVKAHVEDTINTALGASQNNIDINANMFQYSWIFIIGISAVVVFLYTRQLVEYGQIR